MAVAHDEVGTPVDALAHAAAARWRRRVRLGLAVGGVADGLALTLGLFHEYQSVVDPGRDQHDTRLFGGVTFDF